MIHITRYCYLPTIPTALNPRRLTAEIEERYASEPSPKQAVHVSRSLEHWGQEHFPARMTWFGWPARGALWLDTDTCPQTRSSINFTVGGERRRSGLWAEIRLTASVSARGQICYDEHLLCGQAHRIQAELHSKSLIGLITLKIKVLLESMVPWAIVPWFLIPQKVL